MSEPEYCGVKFDPSCGYAKLDEKHCASGNVTAWITREATDFCWDAFLRQTQLGQFQQSTIWARAKAPGGWKPCRVVLTVNADIVGGFQILTRSHWWGKVGYVSKGPVVLNEPSGLEAYATFLLRRLCDRERLRALLVQPPDLSQQISPLLAESGFVLDVSGGVNSATWIISLQGGLEAVTQRMTRETRRRVKQAANRGVTIREGERKDLETFFKLMLSTCKRQRVQPNPPDIKHFIALWDAAYPTRCIRLSFAEYKGTPLTGSVCIPFGDTVTLWKKGWTSTEEHRNPNDLSMYEELKWACQNGYKYCDLTVCDKQMAIAILSGQHLSLAQAQSRHMFNARFGGAPRLLPEAMIYFPNPLIRLAYRTVFCKTLRQADQKHESDRKLVTTLTG